MPDLCNPLDPIDVPPDFQRHDRKSPATAPWEPLFSRRRVDGVDLFFVVHEGHCNSRKFLHGGVLAALCDNAMGMSLGVALNDERANIVTLSLALDYTGSARPGDTVLIEPRVVHRGSSTGICDALVRSGSNVIARANATFRVMSGIGGRPP